MFASSSRRISSLTQPCDTCGADGENKCLLERVLEEGETSRSRIATYLVKALRRAAGGVASVQLVLDRLQPQENAPAGRTGAVAHEDEQQGDTETVMPEGPSGKVADALLEVVRKAPGGQLPAARVCALLYQKCADAKAVVKEHGGIKGFVSVPRLQGLVHFVADQVLCVCVLWRCIERC